MTKGGSSKPKTLGRLIFGEKRKQHASPSRHRSSTQNGGSAADLSLAGSAGVPVKASKSPINLHDWAVWRTQLNEQLGNVNTDRRSDLKPMRQFLQSDPFYQQHSRDPSTGRYNGVRLLFSIPRAKLKPDFLDETRKGLSKSNVKEVEDIIGCKKGKIRSNSDERTTTSVNSLSAIQPLIANKTISQLFPKALLENTGSFLQTNEQMIAADGMHTRRTARSSFTASDRIHSTLQKAVKDGNVLEKIKAFEMQAAAAAQAESATKLGTMSHRMHTTTSSIQSAAHRTLSPGIVHLIQQPVSSSVLQQQPFTRSIRGRYVHPVQQQQQQRCEDIHVPLSGHQARKRPHVLEPALGDIFLKQRTPSEKTLDEEENSITGISSMALTTSQGHHHNQSHRRTSASRSQQRQEKTLRKQQKKQKETATTPSGKSSMRRRWLKGRKETPTETPPQDDKQNTSTIKANKTSKKKKKGTEQNKDDSTKLSTTVPKAKLPSDNNRVYGVPSANGNEQTKTEASLLQSTSKIEEESESDPERENLENTNTYMSHRDDDISQSKECETVIVTAGQRRSSKRYHPQKISSTDAGILSKVDEDTRFSRRSEFIDDGGHSESEVFIEDFPHKSPLNITRHQSVLNVPINECHRFLQPTTNTIRRRASQCSADELISARRDQRSKENSELITTNTLKKRQTPITLITRKNKPKQDEPIVYEAPHSEQMQVPVCNTHTLKKKRSSHTINNTGGSSSEPGQSHNSNKPISKQILHAIMNSMNNNQEQAATTPATAASTNDEFFEKGPWTNPEETIANANSSASK